MFSSWSIIFGLVIGSLTVNHGASLSTPTPAIAAPAVVNESSTDGQLAKCLTKKGAQMFGAYWCPHCADQKKLFGASFQYIKYIECDPKGPNPDPKACEKAGVEAYPTWTIPGGEKLNGTQNLEALAKWSKCNN